MEQLIILREIQQCPCCLDDLHKFSEFLIEKWFLALVFKFAFMQPFWLQQSKFEAIPLAVAQQNGDLPWETGLETCYMLLHVTSFLVFHLLPDSFSSSSTPFLSLLKMPSSDPCSTAAKIKNYNCVCKWI